MRQIPYKPVLKWKKGEQLALKELSCDTSLLSPVIEITPGCTPSAFHSQLVACYNGSVYIDTSKEEDNRDELKNILSTERVIHWNSIRIFILMKQLTL